MRGSVRSALAKIYAPKNKQSEFYANRLLRDISGRPEVKEAWFIPGGIATVSNTGAVRGIRISSRKS